MAIVAGAAQSNSLQESTNGSEGEGLFRPSQVNNYLPIPLPPGLEGIS